MSNKKGLTGTEKCNAVFAITMMFLFYCMIPLGLIQDPDLCFLMIVIFIIYITHACCIASTKFIHNVVGLEKTFENIDNAIKAAPQVSFHIQNYHYETRVETY